MAGKTDERASDEKVVEIEMERLRAENHPFKVIADSQMIELQESIKIWSSDPIDCQASIRRVL